jgi:hypothetical protein
MTSIHAEQIQVTTHVMILHAAALGTSQDKKPVSANNVTNLFFTLSVDSTTLT